MPEQRELFDYWRSKSHDGAYPMRADIQPGELRALLPSLSLLDIVAETEDTVRLRVRSPDAAARLFRRRDDGHFLDEYDLGDQTEYWNGAYREVIGAGRPAQGVIALDAWKQPNVFQFWLRLPLADAEGRIVMVLGHDAFLQSEKAHALAERANLRIA